MKRLIDRLVFRPRSLELFGKKGEPIVWSREILAGATVGLIALPLALALGIASIPPGVATPSPAPALGILTAIVAGLIISALGGSRVQIGGPTAAFVPIILLIVMEHGYGGLVMATMMAGVILILLGVTRMGALIKFIPWPVTSGFTTGIAVAIMITQLQQQLRTLKGVGNITSSASLQRPEVQIIPDVDKAAELGVTVESIAQVIRVATSGDFTNTMPKLNLPQRQVPIRVRLGPSVRTSLQEIAQLRVPSRNGSVSLETVATVRMGSGPQQIDRMDRMRNVTFDIELNKRQIGEVMREVQQLPAMQNLPPSVKQLEAGDAKRMNELFSSFGGAMIIGVMCIYVVLVLLFGDFLQPVTILGALPLSLGGAFFALLVTHNSFSMPSVIGLLMLMGVVTKNSILLVEYTIMARKERQLSRFDAIIDGCHKRARPIIMTTIAMAAGMMPIALGWSADPSFRSPMAITVIGGLITSTLLSLVVIPVLYTYVDDLLGWLRKVARLARKHV